MIQCPYAQQIWKEAKKIISISIVLTGKFIEQSLINWFRKIKLKDFIYLPCLVLWGIWISCSDSLVNVKERSIFKVSSL